MSITTRTDQVSADGGNMPIYVAEPDSAGPHPVVIVFMEAFGVNGHIKDLTGRFASEGYVAIAPDMYYRQGSVVAGYDDIPKIMGVMQSVVDAQTNADVRVAINHIKSLPKADAGKIACTGYCMGGTISWMSACLNRDIKAAAVYYSGGLITRQTNRNRPGSPHSYAELLTAPVLGLFGEEDQNPPPADVREVDAELTKLGKTHEFHIYPNAGHGFFCDERPSYSQAAADDAWPRTLEWFKKHLG